MVNEQIKSKINLIFEKQWLHLLALFLLIPGLFMASRFPEFRRGALWGISTLLWFWMAAGIAILHQVFVWFCWRMELHGRWLSGHLGTRGFPFYAIGFSVLGISRVLGVLMLAISNQASIPGHPIGLRMLAVIFLIPAIYLFYSVKRYFGFRRAFGIDHFDADYRSLPFVDRGIFKYTRNGMYSFGFLLLWALALWWSSQAALVIALFNHVYVWVHYFATERPDMSRIYGNTDKAA